MKRRAAALALGLALLSWSPALGRDLDEDPSTTPPATAQPKSDPAPYVAPPLGIYYVTDTYVADVVTSNGPLTTYTTATVHQSTGSYARILETVGTGEPSVYDRRAFNGRRSLADGRLVAGTYYENYVRTETGFEAVSIVFFQDDAELARLLASTPPATVGGPRPTPSQGIGPLAPPCCAADRPVTTAGPVPTAPAAKPIRPGISLLSASVPLAGLEVLRGRAIALWPRAFVDGREIPIRSWAVIAGDAGEAVATMGAGGVPFRGSWPRLAPPGAAFDLVFRIEVDTPETGRRTVDAAIAVIVRSPALVD
jgi:hypothetical protein